MRKSISTLLLAGVLAVALLAAAALGGATPAQAAGCPKWQLPKKTTISQGNGFVLSFYNDGGRYSAVAHGGRRSSVSEDVVVSSVTAKLVKFVITWRDGSGGIYTGRIDSDGFVSGSTRDRWNPSSRATWRMTKLARCVG